MVIEYTTLLKGIGYALTAFEKILSIGKKFTGVEKRNIKNALIALENAIRLTVEHLEIKSKKYSEKEIADLWKVAGEKLSSVSGMKEATNWIFQKELYWIAGGSNKFIKDKERISISNMLNVVQRLREKIE